MFNILVQKEKTLDFNVENGQSISTYSKYTGTEIYFDFNSRKFNDQHFRLSHPNGKYKKTSSGNRYFVERKVTFEYDSENRTLVLYYRVVYFNAGLTEKSVPEKSDIIISDKVYTSTIVLPNGVASVENTETPIESAEARN
ncbi:hypothetical protein [Mycoplasmopsis gallinacea]|uniref:Uncharacterized protein n=1 Tax=Mycoplasmopsis gallinacea TaxID=29556 RepID=A0A449A2Q9_9BACT|nr:hypothetical protein [Mycoplasmopsis gallinacea]VEU58517.1 Uncharacterised protein [Mycoplasmopsis gallinacea]